MTENSLFKDVNVLHSGNSFKQTEFGTFSIDRPRPPQTPAASFKSLSKILGWIHPACACAWLAEDFR